MANLKRFIRKIKTISYTPNNLRKLHEIDKYGSLENGINMFLYQNPFTREEKSTEPNGDKLSTRLFSTYVIEAFFAYSEGDKNFYLDFTRWNEKKIHEFNEVHHCSLRDLRYLSTDMFSTTHSGSINSLAKILLPLAFEQMDIQITFRLASNRFYYIFASNDTINSIFQERTGISLKKYMALAWIIYAYILKNGSSFKLDQNLLNFTNKYITEDELIIFLNMISLTREEFKKKYFDFRKQDNGTLFDYEIREYFDKGLPKISFFYPLIREGDIYLLTSYTSFHEFFKMRAAYRYMTEQFVDIEFKSKYAGPAFEKYVRWLIEKYNTTFNLEGIVYGNNEYYPKKGIKWHEPDVVFETQDYMLIIECKTTPYSLNLLKFAQNKDLERLKESIKKSIENINDRFLTYYSEKFKNKKIVRIVVFYEAIDFIFSLLKEELSEILDRNSIHIMEARTLELMLSDYTEPLPNIFEKFESRDKNSMGTIPSEIRNIFDDSFGIVEAEEILKELLVDELGLPDK